ncbi:Hypothetical protein FKW44_016499, partial [Caligus rogercresseyi]
KDIIERKPGSGGQANDDLLAIKMAPEAEPMKSMWDYAENMENLHIAIVRLWEELGEGGEATLTEILKAVHPQRYLALLINLKSARDGRLIR